MGDEFEFLVKHRVGWNLTGRAWCCGFWRAGLLVLGEPRKLGSGRFRNIRQQVLLEAPPLFRLFGGRFPFFGEYAIELAFCRIAFRFALDGAVSKVSLPDPTAVSGKPRASPRCGQRICQMLGIAGWRSYVPRAIPAVEDCRACCASSLSNATTSCSPASNHDLPLYLLLPTLRFASPCRFVSSASLCSTTDIVSF